MVDEKTLNHVIAYLAKHGDSETDEEMRLALIWVRDGPLRTLHTPIVIQCALDAGEGGL